MSDMIIETLATLTFGLDDISDVKANGSVILETYEEVDNTVSVNGNDVTVKDKKLNRYEVVGLDLTSNDFGEVLAGNKQCKVEDAYIDGKKIDASNATISYI
jgi:hypothetical protein